MSKALEEIQTKRCSRCIWKQQNRPCVWPESMCCMQESKNVVRVIEENGAAKYLEIDCERVKYVFGSEGVKLIDKETGKTYVYDGEVEGYLDTGLVRMVWKEQ